MELFRQSLIQGWGGGPVGSAGRSSKADWAEQLAPEELRAGDVLLANPAQFFSGKVTGPRRVGLRDGPSPDWPRRESFRLLPVILLTKVRDDGGAEGLWLTMRTGQLMGDFINHFHSRPLLYGGPKEAGLTMVHPYPQVPGSKPLSDGGLYMGGDFAGAQEWVEEGQGSSLRFLFFLNRVRWGAGELAAEVRADSLERLWLPMRCSIDLVLSESGSMNEKPLWARVAELAGGDAEALGKLHGLLD